MRFRYALLIFDITTILFLVGSSFTHHGLAVEIADAVIGLAIVADFTARLWISRNRLGELLHPAGVADLVVIASLLAPLAGEGWPSCVSRACCGCFGPIGYFRACDRISRSFVGMNRPSSPSPILQFSSL
ncbi:hypothetical protein ACFSHQ_23610 [Gemmobacter lanyuensis]